MRALTVATAALVLAACGSGASSPGGAAAGACELGEAAPCACSAGGNGFAMCQSDHTFGACDCGVPLHAHAGIDVTAVAGRPFVLDGSLSRGGPPLRYAWSLVVLPPGSAAVLQAADTVRPTFTGDLPGAYVVELVVDDGVSESAPAHAKLRVIAGTPVAGVDVPSFAAFNQVVRLDGRRSTGIGLTYRWTVVGDGFEAGAPADPIAAQTTYAPPRLGRYHVGLVVTDDRAQSDTAEADLTVETFTELSASIAGPSSRRVVTGAPLVLDGSGSSTVGERVAFTWQILGRPQGSQASGDGETGTNLTFTPDLDGDYVIQLSVGAEFGSASVASVTLHAWHAWLDLGYDLGSATYSPALDRVVVAEQQGRDAIHVLDVATGEDRPVAIRETVLGLGLSLDGRTAVVGHPGRYSTVDLVAGTATISPEIFTWVAGVALPGDGYAYFGDVVHLTESVRALHLSDATVTAGQTLRIDPTSVLAATPGRIYVSDPGGTGFVIADVSSGAVIASRSDIDLDPNGLCGGLLAPAADGHAFYACGSVFRSDFSKVGRIGAGAVRAVFAGSRVLLLNGHLVTAYDASSLRPVSSRTLPIEDLGVDPRYFFANADGTRVFVLSSEFVIENDQFRDQWTLFEADL